MKDPAFGSFDPLGLFKKRALDTGPITDPVKEKPLTTAAPERERTVAAVGTDQMPGMGVTAPKVEQKPSAVPEKPVAPVKPAYSPDVIDVILGEAKGGDMNDMLHVASTIANRAQKHGTSLDEVVRNTNEFNAYGKPLPKGVDNYRGMAEEALNTVLTQGPVTEATFYATPEATKNLPKGLERVTATDGHEYFVDPQGRAIGTETGYKPRVREGGQGGNPQGEGLARIASPEPTEQPSGNAGQLVFRHKGQDTLKPDFKSILADTSGEIGKPLEITSGYRSPNHPVERVKKSGGGEHTKGEASDINMAGMSPQERADLMVKLRARGVERFGVYKNMPDMLHVDMKKMGFDENRNMGGDTPWFMYNKTADQVKDAPDWFKQAMPLVAQTKPGSKRRPVGQVSDENYQLQDPMGLYKDRESPFGTVGIRLPQEGPIPADDPRKAPALSPAPEQTAAVGMAPQPGKDAAQTYADQLNAKEPGRYQVVDAASAPAFQKDWQEQQPSQITKGFKSAILNQTPANVGNALDMFGVLTDSPTLRNLGEGAREIGETGQWKNQAAVPSLSNIRTDSFSNFVSDAADYAGFSLGQAVGSMAPSVGVGLGVGAVTSNPVIGFAAGAAGPSYIQNAGDLYGAARENEGIKAAVARGDISEKEVAGYSAAGGAAMAALDVASLGKVLGGATQPLKEAIKRNVLKRVMIGAGKGAATEGLTEGMQEIISQSVQEVMGSDTPINEQVISVLDNAVGGALGGGAFGGAGGVRKPGEAPAQTQAPTQAPAAAATPQPVQGRKATVNDPSFTTKDGETLPAGNLHGQSVTILPDQDELSGSLVKVQLGDGTITKIGRNLLTSAPEAPKGPIGRGVQHQVTKDAERGGVASAPSITPVPTTAAEVPVTSAPQPKKKEEEGKPAPAFTTGQAVRIVAPGGEVIEGRFDSMADDAEALIFDNNGELFQVPVGELQAAGQTQDIENPSAGPAQDVVPETSTATPPQPAAVGMGITPAAEPAQAAAPALDGEILPPTKADGKTGEQADTEHTKGLLGQAKEVMQRYIREHAASETWDPNSGTSPPSDHIQTGEQLVELFNMLGTPGAANRKVQSASEVMEAFKGATPDQIREFWSMGDAPAKAATIDAEPINAAAPAITSDIGTAEPTVRKVGKNKAMFESENDAKLYDLGEKLRIGRNGSSSMAHVASVLEKERQSLADSFGVSLDRINEIADDFRYRVSNAGRKSEGDYSAPKISQKRLAEWQKEAAEAKLALDTGSAPIDQPIADAAHAAATSPLNDLPQPTEAQKKAGNYKLGHVKLAGFDISIENPQGSKRSGTDKGGKPWSIDMKSHYGYFKGTIGPDKDHIDTFISPVGASAAQSLPVFVVNQVDPATGKFDEPKVMLGYPDEASARAAYQENYAADWKGMGDVVATDTAGLKDWFANGNTKKPFAAVSHETDGEQESTQPKDAQDEVAKSQDATTQREPTVTQSAPPSYNREQLEEIARENLPALLKRHGILDQLKTAVSADMNDGAILAPIKKVDHAEGWFTDTTDYVLKGDTLTIKSSTPDEQAARQAWYDGGKVGEQPPRATIAFKGKKLVKFVREALSNPNAVGIEPEWIDWPSTIDRSGMSDDESASSRVFEQIFKTVKASGEERTKRWQEDMLLQSKQPNRFHKAQQLANRLGLKIGDVITREDGNKAWVVTFDRSFPRGKDADPSHPGTLLIKTQALEGFGGFTSEVELGRVTGNSFEPEAPTLTDRNPNRPAPNTPTRKRTIEREFANATYSSGTDLGAETLDLGNEPGAAAATIIGKYAKGGDVERTIAIDAHGDVVAYMEGTENFSGMSSVWEAAILNQRERLVVHHNHPSSNSFSTGDLGALSRPGMAAVYAYAKDGAIYRAAMPSQRARSLIRNIAARLVRDSNQMPMAEPPQHFLNDAFDVLGVRWKTATYAEIFREKTVDRDVANAEHARIVGMILNDAGIIDYYEHNAKPVTLLDNPVLKETYDETVAAIREQLADVRGDDRPTGPIRFKGDMGSLPAAAFEPSVFKGTEQPDKASGRAVADDRAPDSRSAVTEAQRVERRNQTAPYSLDGAKKTTLTEDEAFELGKKSFTDGYQRLVPPKIRTIHGEHKSRAWYRGWDAASLSAPLPEEAAPSATTFAVPSGYEVDEAATPKDDLGKSQGKYKAIARRLSPSKVDHGYGNTPEEAQRAALGSVGAPGFVREGKFRSDLAQSKMVSNGPAAGNDGRFYRIRKEREGQWVGLRMPNQRGDVPFHVRPGNAQTTFETEQAAIDAVVALAGFETKAKPVKLERSPNETLDILSTGVQKAIDIMRGTEATAPIADTEKFAANKLFTADKVEAARARLRSKMSQLNSGIDPELLIDGMTIAGAYIESGVRKFGDFAKSMADDFGDGIKPYLLSFYEAVRSYPGLDVAGMSTPDEAKAAHADLMSPGIPQSEAVAVGAIVAAPKKRKPRTGSAEDTVLNDDWGVPHIDGWDAKDERPFGPTKDAFLKDGIKYLKSVASALEDRGWTGVQNSKGKIMAPVSRNDGGVAVSGDINLHMEHPETGVRAYINISGGSLRGVVPSTKSGVQVMARVGMRDYGTDGTNQWMQTTLTAGELSAKLLSSAEQYATWHSKKDSNRESERLDQPSPRALEGTPAEPVQGGTGSRDAEPVAADSGGTDLFGNQLPRTAGVQPGRGVADGARAVSPSPSRSRQGSGKAERSARSDTGNERADAGNAGLSPDLLSLPHIAQNQPSDFAITDADAIGEGGLKTKFKQNIAAIRILRTLDEENRPATREEQSALAKWVGWGGMPAAFPREDGSINTGWDREAKELRELLTDAEYDAAKASTRNAHYTAPEVVRAMWNAVNRMGFAGGKVLEPSVGSGNFLGLMPRERRDRSDIVGVELDNITGGIAKNLYPKAKIRAPMGFQALTVPDNYFDLAIGNPPFGSEKLYDADRRHLNKFSIHNYFFGKSIDTLRPGGVLAMVVSNFLMDAQTMDARKYMAERADLLGAIRLPNNAFAKNANTEVTTDIVFMQKRAEPIAINDRNAPDWLIVGKYTDKDGNKVALNQYFIEHPEMMLGEFGQYGTMYGSDVTALVSREGDDLPTMLEDAIKRLPESIMPEPVREPVVVVEKVPDNVGQALVHSAFIGDDGVIYIRQPDHIGEMRASKAEFANDKAAERVRGMLAVRDAFTRIRAAQINPKSTDVHLAKLRAVMNDAYDAFYKVHGPILHDANKRLMRDDPTWPQLAALEKDYDKGVTASMAAKTGETAREPSAAKADIFFKRTQQPYAAPTHAENAHHALEIALSDRGFVDLPFMATLTGKPQAALVEELGRLVFRVPGGDYVTADEYLSGNVKKKLAEALAAAETDADYRRNVRALEDVQPADIEAVDIDAKAGSPWIPAKHIEAFVATVSEANPRDVKAVYSRLQATWEVALPRATDAASVQYGTGRVSISQVVSAALNGKTITVYDHHSDGTSTKNDAETQAANEKVENVKAAWARWIWEDEDRRIELARVYNDTFNTDVVRQYEGSHLRLPGKVSDDIIGLRPHQKNWVWRTLQSSTALADHTVGAGKTFAAIAGIMERRRVGRARKPLLVVPNHLVGQWASDFVKLYPSANILATSKKDFERDNRRQLFARMATGDYDAIIMAHSQFKYLAISPDFETSIINEQIQEMLSAEREMRAEAGKDSRNVKALEKRRQTLESKVKKLIDAGRKDVGLTFEEIGIDDITVDEAHEFKNLPFITGMTRVAGLGNPAGSQKAMDLYMKMRIVADRGGRRFFLTGTPISNTMAEMFTVQRYLSEGDLKSRGINVFDAWARVFGEIVTDWELSPAGVYKMNSRFAKFVNIPELMKAYRGFADVINNDDIKAMLAAQGKKLPLPEVKGGKPEIVIAERSPDQAAYVGEARTNENGGPDWYEEGTLIWRSEHLPKKAEKGADNMLKIMSDARKAALDMRLIEPNYPDFAGSKVNIAADRMVSLYRKWDAKKGVQLVFIDLSTPKGAVAGEKARFAKLLKLADDGDEDAIEALSKVSEDELLALSSDFSVYDDLKAKLIARGIPVAEIAFIHDAKTDAQKEEMFGKVRTGRVRFLFGSTPKMGAGTNVQNRLVGLHHLDAPWRPSDLEQREGRIIRQGNELYAEDPEGFEVEIARYATEKTLDARMWQTIEAKAKFIGQVRKGDAKDRTIDDIGGEAANAAEMKAAASGNPLILEEMELKTKTKKLEGQQNNHDREQHLIAMRLREYRNEKNELSEDLPKVEADAAKAANVKLGEGLEIDGTFFEKQKEVGDEIVRQMLNFERGIGVDSKVLAKLDGFELVMNRTQYRVTVGIQGETYHHIDTERDLLAISPMGLAMKIRNVFGRIVSEPSRISAHIAEIDMETPGLEKQIRPFDKEAELIEVKARHKAVIDQLRPKDKPAAPVEQTPPADAELSLLNDADPLLNAGEWREARIKAETETGRKVMVNAGDAVDLITQRIRAAEQLLMCVKG